MDIWMDMTNSLQVWNGGVVGIIRAELEIACNLKKNYPNIRFSVGNGHGFEEVPSEDLDWLWNADSVTDAYMDKMRRLKKENSYDSVGAEEPIGLREAYAFSDSRRERLREAGRRYISNRSPKVKPLVKTAFYISFLPVSIVSRLRAQMKKLMLRSVKQDKAVIQKEAKFNYPYTEGDIVFSCGWYTSNKEYLFSKVKSELRNFYLVYLVYDIILIKEGTKHLYDTNPFDRYINWISNNCDIILYGGNTAKRDTEQYFLENNLPVPEGHPVKFGAEIVRSSDESSKEKVFDSLGIEEKYIMAVGSIEPRKNYDTIYRAYVLLLERYSEEEIPQFVIIGGAFGENNLLDSVQLDPRLKNKILVIRPTDEELDVLYKNCLFTLLPSLYEGWSLTLPESLGYGKLCLASKVDPLIEIGDQITDFVETMNPVAWAEKIIYYVKNPQEIKKYENLIAEKWVPITWNDCSNMIKTNLINLQKSKNELNDYTIYYDLTLAWNLSKTNAFVSGILRTQLLLARYMSHIIPQMKFFAISPDGFVIIDKCTISLLLENGNIEAAYRDTKPFLAGLIPNTYVDKMSNIQQEINNTSGAFWMACSVLPKRLQSTFIQKGRRIRDNKLKKGMDYTRKGSIGLETAELPFRKNDIIVSTGTGFNEECYPVLIKCKEKIGFKFIQLLYDFTPTLLPQVHMEETRKYYIPFLKNTSLLSDYILYGGSTAMRDGNEYFRLNNLPVRKGYPIKFGSNIDVSSNKELTDEKVLTALGIDKKYILTVGSIELRKNHETLYKAYIEMLKEQDIEIPQMVFAGYPGWKTNELISMLSRDKRIKNKILVITPTDDEMDILYRNCEFTVLPSLYEGWSLTLPESLNYGKFCIASDVDPLRETGQDFIDYVHPFDTMGWAEKILYYANNKEELLKREEKIENEWHAISWEECAEQVAKKLNEIMEVN